MTTHYIYNACVRAWAVLLLCIVWGTVQAQRMEGVDLGLSVEWANMNVGADSPEEYGNYYAWGEVKTKRYYGVYSTYKHFGAITYNKYNYVNFEHSKADNLLVLQAEDDVATKELGSGWRMPTEAEMQELLDNCDFVPEVRNGTPGYRVSRKVKEGESRSGESIFLPKVGYRDYGTHRFYPGTQAYYWTATLLTADSLQSVVDKVFAKKLESRVVRSAKCMTAVGGSMGIAFVDRRIGCAIRPVRSRRR